MNTTCPYIFDPSVFVDTGYETSDGDWDSETHCKLCVFKALHPELSAWGILAIGMAWSEYSQDVYLVSWQEWTLAQRDELFLGYCAWRQNNGFWRLGFDIEALQSVNHWKSTDPVLN
jgi:hypothetical protein